MNQGTAPANAGLIKIRVYNPELRKNKINTPLLATLVVDPSEVYEISSSLHNPNHGGGELGLVSLLQSDMFPFNPNDQIRIQRPSGLAEASWAYMAMPNQQSCREKTFYGYGDTIFESIANLCCKMEGYHRERIDTVA